MTECDHITHTIEAPWLGFQHDECLQPPNPFKAPKDADHVEGFFSSYLKRKLDRLGQKQATLPTRERAAQHQSWLTFGVLEIFLGELVLENKLVEEKEGKFFMSSRNLPSIIRRWADGLTKLDKVERGKQFKIAELALIFARRQLKEILINDTTNAFLYPEAEPEESTKVIAMIAVIAEGLEIAKNQHQFDELDHGAKPFKLVFVLDTCVAYKEEMRAKGWCPFVLRKIESVTAATYASLHEPVRVLSADGHKRCTELRCDANEIKGKPLAKHYLEDSCENLKPPADDIMRGVDLQKGTVPVLTLSTASDSQEANRLKVSAVSKSTASKIPYVAISHVWSDGLRGSTGVGLPKCQLERIDKMTREILPEGSGAFWLDVLCIPKNDGTLKLPIEDIKEKENEGIRLMGETYRNAKKVLVLDSGIRECSKNAPLEEKLLRISTSVWMQRLWTLQEAVYAKEMVFEFRDGLVSINELLPKGMSSLQGHLAIDLYQLTQRMKEGSRDSYSNIWDIARALRTRTAGRVADETLGVVDLIHNHTIDSYELAKIEHPNPEADRVTKSAYEARERMKKILKSIPKLPIDIMFLRGPKLEDDGFRWALKSFMESKGILIEVKDEFCSVSKEGGELNCNLVCLDFDEVTIGPGEQWHFQAEVPTSVKGEKVTEIRFYEILMAESEGKYTFNTIMMPWMLARREKTYCTIGTVDRNSGQVDDTDKVRFNCKYKGVLPFVTSMNRPSGQNLIQAKYVKKRSLRVT